MEHQTDEAQTQTTVDSNPDATQSFPAEASEQGFEDYEDDDYEGDEFEDEEFDDDTDDADEEPDFGEDDVEDEADF